MSLPSLSIPSLLSHWLQTMRDNLLVTAIVTTLCAMLAVHFFTRITASCTSRGILKRYRYIQQALEILSSLPEFESSLDLVDSSDPILLEIKAAIRREGPRWVSNVKIHRMIENAFSIRAPHEKSNYLENGRHPGSVIRLFANRYFTLSHLFSLFGISSQVDMRAMMSTNVHVQLDSDLDRIEKIIDGHRFQVERLPRYLVFGFKRVSSNPSSMTASFKFFPKLDMTYCMSKSSAYNLGHQFTLHTVITRTPNMQSYSVYTKPFDSLFPSDQVRNEVVMLIYERVSY